MTESYPRRESSPNTAAPSTIHCARIVSGSFFWERNNKHVTKNLMSHHLSESMMDAVTHRGRLDRSLLHICSLLTLQAGGQLLVSAVCHLFDQVQTLLHLGGHTPAST